MSNRLPCIRQIVVLVVVFVGWVAPAAAEEIDLFIVTGQSNARVQYANGIDSGIRAIGRYDNPIVFNATRSGNWLFNWVADGAGGYVAGPNFTEDLWAPDGSSALQQFIADLESDGDTVVVRGFFWWQGEGDTGGTIARTVYSEKLQWMIQELWSAYGEFDILFTLIDYNPDELDELMNIGRTPEDVEAIRDQLRDAAEQLGGTVHDSRPYPRSDLWHVSDWDDHRGLYGPAYDIGADEARAFVDHVFCAADLNNDQKADFFDIQMFLNVMMQGCP